MYKTFLDTTISQQTLNCNKLSLSIDHRYIYISYIKYKLI